MNILYNDNDIVGGLPTFILKNIMHRHNRGLSLYWQHFKICIYNKIWRWNFYLEDLHWWNFREIPTIFTMRNMIRKSSLYKEILVNCFWKILHTIFEVSGWRMYPKEFPLTIQPTWIWDNSFATFLHLCTIFRNEWRRITRIMR